MIANGKASDEAASTEPAALTDLGEILFGPNGREEADRVRARLDHLLQTARAELRAGVSRERFETLTVLSEALESADAVMVDMSKATRSKPEAGAS